MTLFKPGWLSSSVNSPPCSRATADARLRLQRAISAGDCPEQPDQVDDVVAHRALLRARLDLLAAQG